MSPPYGGGGVDTMRTRPIDLPARLKPASGMPARPELLPARPAHRARAAQSDVLSDVLRAVHLTGAVFFDFELSSPWVAEAPPSREIASRVMPGAQRVIEFHLIARGSYWGTPSGRLRCTCKRAI
jgi:hypothetical protein